MYKDFFDPPAQGISDTKELKKEKEKKKKVTFENDNGGGTDDLPLKGKAKLLNQRILSYVYFWICNTVTLLRV